MTLSLFRYEEAKGELSAARLRVSSLEGLRGCEEWRPVDSFATVRGGDYCQRGTHKVLD